MPKSSDFGPKSDDSAHRILKSKNGLGPQSSKTLTEQTLVQQQYEVHTEVRAAINALDHQYNHDARTQLPRLFPARLQLAVGRCWLGHGDREEQRTQRASSLLRITREYTQHQQQSVIVLGSDTWSKKRPREAPRHVSSRPD